MFQYPLYCANVRRYRLRLRPWEFLWHASARGTGLGGSGEELVLIQKEELTNVLSKRLSARQVGRRRGYSYGGQMKNGRLELSTSPRSTWVWAADSQQAEELLEVLTAGCCTAHRATGRNAEPRVLDLDIGVVALKCLEMLDAAGYTFTRHEQQHPLNRRVHFYDIPVSETAD